MIKQLPWCRGDQEMIRVALVKANIVSELNSQKLEQKVSLDVVGWPRNQWVPLGSIRYPLDEGSISSVVFHYLMKSQDNPGDTVTPSFCIWHKSWSIGAISRDNMVVLECPRCGR